MSTGTATPWGGTALVLGFPKAVARRLGDALSGLDYEGLTAQTSQEALVTLLKPNPPRVAFVSAGCLAGEGLAFLRVLRTHTGTATDLPAYVLGDTSGQPDFVLLEADRLHVVIDLPAVPDKPLLRSLLPGEKPAPISSRRTSSLRDAGRGDRKQTREAQPTYDAQRETGDFVHHGPTDDRRARTSFPGAGVDLSPTLRTRLDGKMTPLPVENASSERVVVRSRAKLPESENLHLYYKGRLSVADAIQDTSVHILARVTSKVEDLRSTSYVLEVLAARPDESYEALIRALQAAQTMDRI